MAGHDSLLSVKTTAQKDQDSEGDNGFLTKDKNSDCKNSVGPGLLDAVDLLAEIWPRSNSRPSLRWLREQQRKRTVPYIKVGHKVFFNPAKVRQALEKNFTVDCL